MSDMEPQKTQQVLDFFRREVRRMFPGPLPTLVATSPFYLQELRTRLGEDWGQPGTAVDSLMGVTRVQVAYRPTAETYSFDLQEQGPLVRLVDASIRREA